MKPPVLCSIFEMLTSDVIVGVQHHFPRSCVDLIDNDLDIGRQIVAEPDDAQKASDDVRDRMLINL